ncbi:cytochrome C oxidase subunit IV family protein [Ammoniphilus sp. CFH 90114]|uniref:cytochrome C oxidase subunit IV family protein n=1 Tax=Ammoniphilus sp. CFH 90114 TaxID=2493665 RepID=UPI00100FDBA4|nr:cytochrome C oxidase subunit IV family protein [Ammoniphilus sp. CFH 90114]RXT05657.1 cytochrome C oxidase subunit IV [Ammoniphilus sp. CFH 90114]
MGQQINHTETGPKHHKPEGKKRHIVAFIVSIILTAIAFLAVILGGSNAFVIPFIIVLGIIQAGFQLYIWMHMDQKGHELPELGIYTGLLVAVVTVIVFAYWMGGY